MSDYIKLAEAPRWVIQYPLCSACNVELDTDGDGWTCNVCGTSWDMNAGDGDEGALYEDWSGETLDGPVLSEKQAAAEGYYRDRLASHERWPDLVAKPRPPEHRASA